MGEITGLTAARMALIEASAIVGADVIDDDLLLRRHDTSTINAGRVGISWWSAWHSDNTDILQAWFENYTGPQVPCDEDNPVVGIQNITFQAQADLLTGKVINGAVRILSPALDVHSFKLYWNPVLGYYPITIVAGAVASGKIHHVEVDGLHSTTHGCAIWSGSSTSLDWSGWEIHHNKIHGCSDGFSVFAECHMMYNYVYDPLIWDNDVDGEWDVEIHPHSDGMQCSGGNPYIIRNFLNIAPPGKRVSKDTDNIISAIEVYPRFAPITAGLIKQNYVNGGTSTLRFPGVGDDEDEYALNLLVDDNRFGPDFKQGLWWAGAASGGDPDVGWVSITRTASNRYMGFPGTTAPMEGWITTYRPTTRWSDSDMDRKTDVRKLYEWTAGTVTYSKDGGTTLPPGNVTTPITMSPRASRDGGFYLQRVGNQVLLDIVQAVFSGTINGSFTVDIPDGFGIGSSPFQPVKLLSSSAGIVAVRVSDDTLIFSCSVASANVPNTASTGPVSAQAVWVTDAPFPDEADWPGVSY